MTHKLTKEIYLPLVEGSNWGVTVVNGRLMSAFVGFRYSQNYLWKVESFNNAFNWILGLPVMKSLAYQVYGTEFEAVQKNNKYLRKQYRRMAKHLANGDIERYTAIYELLRWRSDCFLITFWVKKAKDYKHQIALNHVWWHLKSIRNNIRSNSTKLKSSRVFLREENSDGTLKKLRPLTVPKVEWRVSSGMDEFYLVNLLKKDWCENQYACMPRRGVVDAWIDILSNIINQPNVVGIDLAKFFDTVFIKTVSYSLHLSGVPEGIISRLELIHLNNKPHIGPKDKQNEANRITALREEAPVMLYPPVEDLMTSVPEHNWNDRDKSLPQGLNTSPLLACHVLNTTNALDRDTSPNMRVVQYVDDGVIAGGPSPEVMLRRYTTLINPYTTGITVSEKKTEIIKQDGSWVKPLKFLGCEYDGQTFRAHTRKNGVITIKNADERISQIIKWLEANRGNIIDYPRKHLSRLINEGWNNESYIIGNPGIERSLGFAQSRKSLWDKYRAKLTKVSRGSVEWKVIEKYRGTGSPLIYSTNTMSMLCAGTILNSSYKAKKPLRTVKPKQEAPQRTKIQGAILQIVGFVTGLMLMAQLLMETLKTLVNLN